MNSKPVAWGNFMLEGSPDRLVHRGVPLDLDAHSLMLLRVLLTADGVVPEIRLKSRLTVTAAELMQRAEALNIALAQADPKAGYVAHFPGRGFSLVRLDGKRNSEPSSVVRAPVIGRDRALAALAVLFAHQRLATIVGPGGMGKTTLALEFARRYATEFADGCLVVDLAPVSDPAHVLPALVAVVDLQPWGGDPQARFRAALRHKQVLVVIDNCEHLLEAVAELTQDILTLEGPLRILATSREPLFVNGESVFRIEPLNLAANAAALQLTKALDLAAIQLFVERARAAQPSFSPDQRDVPTLARICQRLDGMPLAIEIAAARVQELGLRELAQQLVERPLVALQAERVSRGRHCSLLQMMDWSFTLLETDQQRTLVRLSVFRGPFTYDAAVFVVSDALLDEGTVEACILALTEKSLIAISATPGTRVLRLLDTTREYADGKLSAMDRAGVRLRHARFLLDLLEGAEANWEKMHPEEWRQTYSAWLHDIRAAIDWSFSDGGDVVLGVSLTIAGIAVAAHAGLMSEFDQRARIALEKLKTFQPRQPLLEALLMALPVIARPSALDLDDSRHADLLWSLDVCRRMGTVRQRLTAPIALWCSAFFSARYDDALRWIKEADQLVRVHGDVPAQRVVTRARALTLGSAGAHAEACALAQDLLAEGRLKGPLLITGSPVSPAVSMRTTMSRSLWCQGLPDQAWGEASEAVRLAVADGPSSVCCALAIGAMPVALWRGDIDAFAALLPQLRDAITEHHAPYWTLWRDMYEQALHLLQQASSAEISALRLEGLQNVVVRYHMWSFRLGTVDQGVVEDAMAGRCGWCGPELLRAAAVPSSSEALLRRALRLADQHGAAGWSLRAASSLAILLSDRCMHRDAIEVLEPAYERFTEGFDTADLRTAGSLLEALR
ncbi:ATP-binding protein [Rubrivivax sp. RP6-9]|uniref:ATP-binding protein n=1 Tax=Rubrivivax sp. RP6-9 TaxID=3415750 RepID=UPI003CC6B907